MATTPRCELRRAGALVWLAVAPILELGCQNQERVVAEDATPTPTQTAQVTDNQQLTTSPPSAEPRVPKCRRAFQFQEDEKEEDEPLLLPHPFAEFTLCDVLVAIFPDFDTAVERSTAAGGTVRVDHIGQWVTSKRTLLVVAHYIGEDAEAEFVCGSCRVNPQLAVLERSGTTLTLVVRGTVPGWGPDAGLFHGRTEFDPRSYSFQYDETLLGMRTPWSYGMMGGTTRLSLFRLVGPQLSLVFDDKLEWVASGMGLDDDVVSADVSQQRRASGADDLVLTIHQSRCRWEEDKRVCGPQKLATQQRWRFDSKHKRYRQIGGKPMPTPQLFRSLWGW